METSHDTGIFIAFLPKSILLHWPAPPQDSANRATDFHALRHSFVSNLPKGGASSKVAQQLARRNTINLTMDLYAHLSLYDERPALEGELPHFVYQLL